jgi:GTP-binding protein
MRREGFEMCISPPKVLLRTEGERTLQPIEEVIVDVDMEYSGMIIEKMAHRKGELKEFKDIQNRTRLVFYVPSRGLMGFRSEAMTDTHGSAVVNSTLSHYAELQGDFSGLRKVRAFISKRVAVCKHCVCTPRAS